MPRPESAVASFDDVSHHHPRRQGRGTLPVVIATAGTVAVAGAFVPAFKALGFIGVA